jgi:anti-anti-sigma regulatory factor
MEILVTNADARVPVTVLSVRGQLNAETAPELQSEAEQAIKAGARHLLLDLREASYISSAGMRVMAYLMVVLRKWSDEERGAGKQKREGGRKSPYLKLLGPTPEVRRALNLVGFDLFLDIHSDYEAALAAF